MEKLLPLVALLGFSGGVILGTVYSIPLPYILFSALLSVGLFLFWFFGKRDAYLLVALFLLCLTLGGVRALFVVRTVPAPFAHILGPKSELTGTIAGDPDMRETNQHLIVRVREGTETLRVLVIADRYPLFAYGDVVRVSGKVETPQPFDTDGGRVFAYDKFLAKDGILALMPHAHIVKIDEDRGFVTTTVKLLYEGKHFFVRALESALPEPHASLAEGILVGGKQGLGPDLLDAFTVAGLLPIIVLSGYNVMIVAESVLVLLGVLPKRYALLLSGVTVAVFVFIAGGGSSAVRAGIMAGLALFARATGRTYDALRALCLVFILMLLISPLELAYDPGFQFSFAATLGLILGSSLIEARLSKISWRGFREVVATTLAAQLFVLPLLLFQTGNMSLVALPANIAILPIVPFTMALCALAGVVALVLPGIALYVGLPAYTLLSYIIAVAGWSASVPFAHVVLPEFNVFLLPVLYLPVALLFVWLQKTAPAKAGAVSALSSSS